jgi:hypothetical protein
MSNAAWVGSHGECAYAPRRSAPAARVALGKGGHEAAIELRAVPGVGAELVLSVDGELRRTWLYRAHEQAELEFASG